MIYKCLNCGTMSESAHPVGCDNDTLHDFVCWEEDTYKCLMVMVFESRTVWSRGTGKTENEAMINTIANRREQNPPSTSEWRYTFEVVRRNGVTVDKCMYL